MLRSHSLVATAAFLGFAITSMGFAQQGGQQQPPARSLDTALAVEAAQTAVNTCLDSGVKGSAAVVDSAGVLRVQWLLEEFRRAQPQEGRPCQ